MPDEKVRRFKVVRPESEPVEPRTYRVVRHDPEIAEDADKWRLAQAEELMIRFEGANGYRPMNPKELEVWLAEQGDSVEELVEPRPEAVERTLRQ